METFIDFDLTLAQDLCDNEHRNIFERSLVYTFYIVLGIRYSVNSRIRQSFSTDKTTYLFVLTKSMFIRTYDSNQRVKACLEESAIHPLPHTWTHRRSRLDSVAVIDRRLKSMPLPSREYSQFCSLTPSHGWMWHRPDSDSWSSDTFFRVA